MTNDEMTALRKEMDEFVSEFKNSRFYRMTPDELYALRWEDLSDKEQEQRRAAIVMCALTGQE